MTLDEKQEQEMMEMIAEFMLKFRERFGDGLRVTVKPINKKRRWKRCGLSAEEQGKN